MTRTRLGLLAAALIAAIGGITAGLANGSASAWQGSWNASYQAAQPGDTITVPAGTYGNVILEYRQLPSCDPNNPSKLITLDVPSNVRITGNLEVHGPCVYIRGRTTGTMADWKSRTFTVNVDGYTSVEGDSSTRYPHGVRIEGVNTGNLGTYSADDVIVRDIDVGPRLLDASCNFPENRIGANGASGHPPTNVLWERVAVHDQNRTLAAANNGCHYGGLQFWFSRNVTIRDSVFERNVVYHIDVGEGGGGPQNGVITNSSFSCPAENSWVGDVCDGQRAVQFDQPANFAGTFTLTNNKAANGPGGLYGCYSEPCSFAGMTVSGNTELAESTTAPGSSSPPPPPPPPPACDPGNLAGLRVIAEDATTLTVAWDPRPAGEFIYFFVDGKRVSWTADSTRTTVRFSKGATCYGVESRPPADRGETAG